MSRPDHGAFNLELIADRGGNLSGYDKFSIEACDRCGGHYLYNAELRDVYYDDEDLSRRFFRVAGLALPPCSYCGALEWQFSLSSPDRASAQSGPWGFVLTRRQFVF